MDKRLIFILLTIISCLFLFLSNELLLSKNLYFSSLGEQLSYEQIEKYITLRNNWEWLAYIMLPAILLIKITLVASCLSLGLLFVSDRFAFKQLFGVALVAEFVFLVPTLLKILWFTFVQTDYDLQDLQYFYPLSALNLFEAKALQTWWLYPLQTFNVFEVIYWVLLIQGVEKIFPTAGLSAWVSYGTGLVLWMAVIMFVSVSFSA